MFFFVFALFMVGIITIICVIAFLQCCFVYFLDLDYDTFDNILVVAAEVIRTLMFIYLLLLLLLIIVLLLLFL